MQITIITHNYGALVLVLVLVLSLVFLPSSSSSSLHPAFLKPIDRSFSAINKISQYRFWLHIAECGCSIRLLKTDSCTSLFEFS